MPKTRFAMRLAAVSIAAALAAAAATPPPKPSGSIASALAPFIENHTLAGAVTLVASQDKVLSLETIGHADIAAKKPMTADALFWIASMSKPITGAALMMLVDEGKVKVDDPVEKYLPEFKDLWLAAEKDKDHILLKRPARPITVHDILTHTSGLPPHSAMEKPTLDLFTLFAGARSYAMTALDFQPGTKYQYSNAGINTAGRIIEAVTGMKYEDFLDRRLFGPLKMTDTTFWPSGKRLGRLAKSYKSNNEKKDLEEVVITQLRYPLDDHTRQPMPAGGLFSTARDLARFCQMVLNGGTLEGRKYLSADAVRQMTSVQTGEIPIGNGASGYGFGWSVLRKPAGDGRSAGSFGHGGAYKTAMWVDPEKKLVLVLLRHHSGQFHTPDGNKLEGVFLKTAMERYGKGK
jgi:CubicO group peptidase (beta-lactamase class C family)